MTQLESRHAPAFLVHHAPPRNPTPAVKCQTRGPICCRHGKRRSLLLSAVCCLLCADCLTHQICKASTLDSVAARKVSYGVQAPRARFMCALTICKPYT